MVERKRGESSHIFFNFLQKLLPLCHQPSEIPVFQTHAGGGSKVAGGSKAPTTPQPTSPTPSPSPIGRGAAAHREVMAGLVTSNDSPNAFTTVKTAFSCGENAVFQRRKRHLPAWQHTHCCHPLCAAAPLPIGEGLGVGLFGLCCHSPTICHHLCFPFVQRVSAVLVAEWQQKQEKNFFYWCPTRVLFLQHLWH